MIVADASPLIALARISHLELCRELFEVVAIPAAVSQEITRHPRGFEGPQPDWIVPQNVQDLAQVEALLLELDRGEAEAVALASELGAALLIDEEAGRRVARSRGIAVTGTLGILLAAKRAALIPRVGPLLLKLQAENFHMSRQLMVDLVSLAGERNP